MVIPTRYALIEKLLQELGPKLDAEGKICGRNAATGAGAASVPFWRDLASPVIDRLSSELLLDWHHQNLWLNWIGSVTLSL